MSTVVDAERWIVIDTYKNASESYKGRHPREILILSTDVSNASIADVASLTADAPADVVGRELRNARLLAASPELRDALSDLVGLISLLAVRTDLPPDLPAAMRSNHRYQTAIALLKRLEERV